MSISVIDPIKTIFMAALVALANVEYSVVSPLPFDLLVKSEDGDVIAFTATLEKQFKRCDFVCEHHTTHSPEFG